MARFITHGGSFHADDVFSAALLYLVCGDIDEEPVFFGERVERVIEVPTDLSEEDIVFDIGGGKFDHHQNDKIPKEQILDGTYTDRIYASFGLLWKEYGMLAIDVFKEVIKEKGASKEYLDKVYKNAFEQIDLKLVSKIDLTDNYGQEAFPNILSYAIACMNRPEENDRCFALAVETAYDILANVLYTEIHNAELKLQVEEIVGNSPSGIAVLKEYMPSFLFKGTKIKYLIYKSNREGYNVSCVKPNLLPTDFDTNDGCIYLSKDLYFATFDTEEHAIEAATWLIP